MPVLIDITHVLDDESQAAIASLEKWANDHRKETGRFPKDCFEKIDAAINKASQSDG